MSKHPHHDTNLAFDHCNDCRAYEDEIEQLKTMCAGSERRCAEAELQRDAARSALDSFVSNTALPVALSNEVAFNYWRAVQERNEARAALAKAEGELGLFQSVARLEQLRAEKAEAKLKKAREALENILRHQELIGGGSAEFSAVARMCRDALAAIRETKPCDNCRGSGWTLCEDGSRSDTRCPVGCEVAP